MKTSRKDTIFRKYKITKRNRAARRASKVLYLYFKYMFEVLLEKKSFHINSFGTLRIIKTMADRNNLSPTPRYYKNNTYLPNSNMLNKKMIGEIVSVSFKGMFNKEYKERFKVCKSFRKRLTELLYKTDYGKSIPLCQ